MTEYEKINKDEILETITELEATKKEIDTAIKDLTFMYEAIDRRERFAEQLKKSAEGIDKFFARLREANESEAADDD